MPFCVLLLTSEMHIKKSDPDILFRILPLSFSLCLYLLICPAFSRALMKVFLWGSAHLGFRKLACMFEKGNYSVSRLCWCFGAVVLTHRSLFGSSRLWRGSIGSRTVRACVCAVGRMQPLKSRGSSHGAVTRWSVLCSWSLIIR